MLIVPFSDFASFDQEIILDDIPYRIQFDYNVLYGFWSMSFKTRDLTPIISGVKLILNYNLFDQYPELDLPPGELYVVDTTNSVIKIDRENILDPLAIVYITKDELGTI